MYASQHMSGIKHWKLDNGLRVVVEAMTDTRAVAVQWLVPAGAACDGIGHDGDATVLAEIMLRGAGDRDAREHAHAMERLGVRCTTTAGVRFLRLGATLLGSHLDKALPLLIDMVRLPSLSPDALPACLALCEQSLASLSDDPALAVGIELDRRHLPPPLNRSGYGQLPDLRTCTLERVRDAHARGCRPGGSILSLAGDLKQEQLADTLEASLGSWEGAATDPESLGPAEHGTHHVEQDTSQSHLAGAIVAPDAGSPHRMAARIAATVLGGGSSSRLFTQVRQKRSLCYSVGAGHAATRDHGQIRWHAGTTPDRADETVAVCLEEIDRMRQGIDREEFDRAIARLRSSVVMHGESSRARARSLASDVFTLGQGRSLAAMRDEVEAATLEEVNAWLEDGLDGASTLVVLGPSPLAAADTAR